MDTLEALPCYLHQRAQELDKYNSVCHHETQHNFP